MGRDRGTDSARAGSSWCGGCRRSAAMARTAPGSATWHGSPWTDLDLRAREMESVVAITSSTMGPKWTTSGRTSDWPTFVQPHDSVNKFSNGYPGSDQATGFKARRERQSTSRRLELPRSTGMIIPLPRPIRIRSQTRRIPSSISRLRIFNKR